MGDARVEEEFRDGEMLSGSVNTIYYMFQKEFPVKGKLYLTNFRTLFAPEEKDLERMSIPHLTVVKIEKIGGKRSSGKYSYLIEFQCKDFRVVRFAFLPSENKRKMTFDLVKRHMQPENTEKMFCFFHSIQFAEADGWKLFSMEDEFCRQGALNSGFWRLSVVNQNYELAPTYPPFLIVPEIISDEELMEIGKFRSKGRVPVLSWYNHQNYATLCRSSQPLVGLLRSESKEDQKLLDSILKPSELKGKATQLLIMDLRPKLNAMANEAKGAGYERTAHYDKCELRFLGIENIHVVRQSFKRLFELCVSTGGSDPNWLSSLESTGWLSHIQSILAATRVCVESIHTVGQPVLLHCSDGWDRTSQVVGLAEVCLDPYYRTIRGFCVLIEKDWLMYGHKFHTRVGHGGRNFWGDQCSPIFLQFIDSVFQLMQQNPCEFEFREDLLIFIMDVLYSCEYGTFLFDCHRERIEMVEHSPSVWSYILENMAQFKNPLYVGSGTPTELEGVDVIIPDHAIPSVRFWSRYFLRWCKTDGVEGYAGTLYSERLYDRAEELLRKESELNEASANFAHSTENTVKTFQSEIRAMASRLEEEKLRREGLENMLREMGVSEDKIKGNTFKRSNMVHSDTYMKDNSSPWSAVSDTFSSSNSADQSTFGRSRYEPETVKVDLEKATGGNINETYFKNSPDNVRSNSTAGLKEMEVYHKKEKAKEKKKKKKEKSGKKLKFFENFFRS